MTRVLCLGGAALDRTYRIAGPARLGSSNPAAASAAPGGVARNVAETLGRLGVDAALASLVGDDAAGAAVRAATAAAGVDVAPLETVPGAATAEYVAALDGRGELVLGVAAMMLLDRLDAGFVGRRAGALAEAGLAFADCNLTPDGLAALLAAARAHALPLAVDGVSVAKARRLPHDLSGVAVLFVARDEAQALVGEAEPEELAAALVARGAGAAVVTLGADGLVFAEAEGAAPRRLPARATRVVDVTGAGDSLIAGALSRLAEGAPLEEALEVGLALAALAVAAPGAVRVDLSPALLADALAGACDG